DELTAMASEHCSSGPALYEMTPGTICSGLVPTSSPSTSYVPPSQNDWDLLFQSMFDELLNPQPSVVNQTPKVIAPIPEVIPLVIPQDVGDDNLDMEVAHMRNDMLFGVPIPEVTSVQSTTPASPQAIVQTNHPMPHHNSNWTKDLPLNNIIGQLSRPVSTRLQLHEQALFCYYDAFLTSVEPKTYTEALTQSCWIEAMQEELNEFERLESVCLNVTACACCVTTESELKTKFLKNECYDTLLQKYHTLEKHCITLEVNNQLNTEIFLRDTWSSQESALTFAELFEINNLKAQAQAKDTVILKLKEKLNSLNGDVKDRNVKRDVEEIETLNIELDHKVTKLVAKNKNLKQTYKQLYDSVKSSRVRSKEQCDDLINKVNLKSTEVFDLNTSLQEKVLVITALKVQLNKLKGKMVLTEAISLNPIDPELLKVDVAPLVPKLCKNRTAHTDNIRHA
nr:integrase, catalytic region, zinc finger, CCHC-type, peptidase aspartic, catalytic [Tanacetum cinerariifolium]